MPKRIQLSRRRGWKKPPNCIVVSRPSVFGNPWSLVEAKASGLFSRGHEAEVVVNEFRVWLLNGGDPERLARDPKYAALAERRAKLLARLADLRGKDLACWCKIGQACHADVLIELANHSGE